MVAERWQATWEENVRVAQLADAYGLDFMLPIGRWKGYGGPTDYEGTTFETLTWASGLLARTKRITVFGTVHTPLFHPVIAAKQMVTADHIGRGRLGLNIVCGWNEGEFEMFGIGQRGHAERYEHGDEWIRAVRLLWSEVDDADFCGKYFTLKRVRGKPKPWGGSQPFVINAGASPDGQDFAIRNCDGYFTGVRTAQFDERTGAMVPDLDRAATLMRSVRGRAESIGREIGIYSRAEIFCRPTHDEALSYYRYAIVENADWEAVENQLEIFGVKNDGSAEFEARKLHHVRGFPIIGTPDRVAAALRTLADGGFDGLAISFVNYGAELPYFAENVLPRLEEAGLRQKVL